ncbi:hypothetical protein HBI56_177810 [Parastagonospora nodorum]|nr:hypothetical protein HBH53_244350 [Parastagonospora nodorum]KAH3973189.1 hypothetical protein HBH52_147280 [Parastagonospora nodorum]KAH4004148.1 hypothetical protein HBI10_054230 [Parastagonospora nodorum]KAH4017067.1 hypothetical protein HBI13_147060 [Parastagonospora nodorum]KAH4038254.1 hypothetical protein HBI09_048910 [Parastagonospora nodorum]
MSAIPPAEPNVGDGMTNLSSSHDEAIRKSGKDKSTWRKVYDVLTWTPPNCRWDPKKPPQFSMSMNVLFAFAAGCKLDVETLFYTMSDLVLTSKKKSRSPISTTTTQSSTS